MLVLLMNAFGYTSDAVVAKREAHFRRREEELLRYINELIAERDLEKRRREALESAHLERLLRRDVFFFSNGGEA